MITEHELATLARKCQRQEKTIEKLRAVETAARRVLDAFYFGDSAADLRDALDALHHFDANTQTAANLEAHLSRLEDLPVYDYEAEGQ